MKFNLFKKFKFNYSCKKIKPKYTIKPQNECFKFYNNKNSFNSIVSKNKQVLLKCFLNNKILLTFSHYILRPIVTNLNNPLLSILNVY